MGCILSCFWCFVAAGWDGWGSGFGCCVGRFLVAMWAGILGLYRMYLPCVGGVTHGRSEGNGQLCSKEYLWID